MTQAQAVSWLNAQIGQHLDYDKVYGQQCFDFFNYYYQALTGDNPYADGYAVSGAKDIWNVPTTRFTKVADSSSLVPQPGDIMVYGASWGAGYGHVEVCLVSNASGSYLVGENEHNNPSEGVVKVYRTWAQMAGLLGVLRPHFDPATVTQGDPMATLTSIQDLDFLYQTMIGRARDSANHEGENVYLNKDYRFVAIDLYNSKEAGIIRASKAQQLNDLQAQANQVPTLTGKVNDLTAVVANQQKQIDSLKAEIAANTDSVQLNALGAALKWFIARLGLK